MLEAGYQASSKYPNKVYVEGQIDTTKARYVKILMTASNNNRAVVFNEIVINDGEYVPVMNDPTFDSNVIEVQGHQPQNMFDGDLTTSYKPNTTHRYIDPSHLSISFFILPKAKGMPKTYTIDNPINRNI